MLPPYPLIGTEVSFVRANPDGTLIEGKGQVRAVMLNHDRNHMVQVVEGGNAFNIYLALINPTPEKIEQFGAMLKVERELTEEGNAKVKEIVDQYNVLIAAQQAPVLGEPVDLGDVAKVVPEPSEAL